MEIVSKENENSIDLVLEELKNQTDSFIDVKKEKNNLEINEELNVEYIMISFLLKDEKYISFFQDNQVNQFWFKNEDLRAFYLKILSFYKKNNKILNKKYFIDLIRIRNISNIEEYELFYDSIYNLDYTDYDFDICFSKWKREILKKQIFDNFKEFYENTKDEEELELSYNKLYKNILEVKTIFEKDTDKNYKLASLKEDAKLVLEDFYNRKHNPELYSGYDTGFEDLDERFSGIQKGKMTIIFGLSSTGKTSFARNITRNIQKKYGAKICVISCEESRVDYLKKIVCAECDINYRSANKGFISSEDFEKASNKIKDISEEKNGCYSIIEVDAKKYTLEEIEVIIEKEFGKGYFDVVLLDHLSLIKPNKNNNFNKNQQNHIDLGDISKKFRDMAKKHNFAGILIAQGKRASIVRDSKNKKTVNMDLENIEGSNQPGQDADSALGIFLNKDNPGVAEITIAKDREGEKEYTISLSSRLDVCRFDNYEESPGVCEITQQTEGVEFTDGNFKTKDGAEINIPIVDDFDISNNTILKDINKGNENFSF